MSEPIMQAFVSGERREHFHMPIRTVVTNLGLDWVWDDARFPDWFWHNVTLSKVGEHWVVKDRPELAGYYVHAFITRRLLSVPWKEVASVVATCGLTRCVNPSHLWVTLKEVAS